MTIIVCPAAGLPDVCRSRSPSHIVTLAAPGRVAPPLPPGARHLGLVFHDIVEPRDGLVAPARGSVERLLAFGRDWTGIAPLVVSCELGISRSPAAAFSLACQNDPGVPEREIAAALRRAAPCATPNARIVALADDILGRGGRMSAAIAAIGRGQEYRPYAAFELAGPFDGRLDDPGAMPCTPRPGML